MGAVSPFVITDFQYAPDAVPNPTVTLTWGNTGAASYAAFFSPDLRNWDGDLDDSILPADDENPGDPDTITVTFELVGPLATAADLFFRVESL